MKTDGPGQPFRAMPDGVLLFVRVTPGAGHNKIGGIKARDDGTCLLGILVTAPPDKNKANRAVVALVAKWLGVAKSTVSIKAGHTAREKTVMIPISPKTLQQALKRLNL
jgi:uncharacterized protein